MRIAAVCLGNICRSPMADIVLRKLLADTDIEVASCGTGDWHVGKPMDPRTAEVLEAAGYDPSQHRAQQFGPDWYDYDLILVMDSTNRADVLAQLPPDRHDRVRLFRDFDPDDPGADTPDPYWSGPEEFEAVLEIIERTSRALIDELALDAV